jgi:hypothetical protein
MGVATREWRASRASESMVNNDGYCLYVFVSDGGRVCGITWVFESLLPTEVLAVVDRKSR